MTYYWHLSSTDVETILVPRNIQANNKSKKKISVIINVEIKSPSNSALLVSLLLKALNELKSGFRCNGVLFQVQV